MFTLTLTGGGEWKRGGRGSYYGSETVSVIPSSAVECDGATLRASSLVLVSDGGCRVHYNGLTKTLTVRAVGAPAPSSEGADVLEEVGGWLLLDDTHFMNRARFQPVEVN